MSTKNKRREKTNLIKKARWAGYAAAGAATAVAGHETAEAGITHKDPADVTLNAAVGSVTATSTGLFDLNMDGVNDIAFIHQGVITSSTPFGAPGSSIGAAFAVPLSNTFGSSNAVGGFIGPGSVGTGGTVFGYFPYVYNLPALPTWTPVNSSTPNMIAGGTLAFVGGYTYSEFTAPGDGYVGVRFDSAAGTHFGWIRVEMSGVPLNSITVAEWAYGMPGQTIHVGEVPEPGSLGLLAFGATGLMAWRRRRGQASLERAQESEN